MTLLLQLYFWLIPWYTWEAILPKRQQMPKVYQGKVVRPFDANEFNKQYCRHPYKKEVFKPLAK